MRPCRPATTGTRTRRGWRFWARSRLRRRPPPRCLPPLPPARWRSAMRPWHARCCTGRYTRALDELRQASEAASPDLQLERALISNRCLAFTNAAKWVPAMLPACPMVAAQRFKAHACAKLHPPPPPCPRTRRWQQAAADAAALTQRWPEWPRGWFRAGRAAEGQGSNVAAAHAFARAWQLLDAAGPHEPQGAPHALS